MKKSLTELSSSMFVIFEMPLLLQNTVIGILGKVPFSVQSSEGGKVPVFRFLQRSEEVTFSEDGEGCTDVYTPLNDTVRRSSSFSKTTKNQYHSGSKLTNSVNKSLTYNKSL